MLVAIHTTAALAVANLIRSAVIAIEDFLVAWFMVRARVLIPIRSVADARSIAFVRPVASARFVVGTPVIPCGFAGGGEEGDAKQADGG